MRCDVSGDNSAYKISRQGPFITCYNPQLTPQWLHPKLILFCIIGDNRTPTYILDVEHGKSNWLRFQELTPQSGLAPPSPDCGWPASAARAAQRMRCCQTFWQLTQKHTAIGGTKPASGTIPSQVSHRRWYQIVDLFFLAFFFYNLLNNARNYRMSNRYWKYIMEVFRRQSSQVVL